MQRTQARPEYLALQRRVTMAPTGEQARVYAKAVADRLKRFVAEFGREAILLFRSA